MKDPNLSYSGTKMLNSSVWQVYKGSEKPSFSSNASIVGTCQLIPLVGHTLVLEVALNLFTNQIGNLLADDAPRNVISRRVNTAPDT